MKSFENWDPAEEETFFWQNISGWGSRVVLKADKRKTTTRQELLRRGGVMF